MVNKCAVFATMLCAAALSSTPRLQAQQLAVKNIVLVHGRLGGRFGLERRLQHSCQGRLQCQHRPRAGTSFQDDVTAVKRILALQGNPDRAFLSPAMGIRDYGSRHTSISCRIGMGIAAHMPDAGENEGDDGKRFPSDLGKSDALKKTWQMVSRTSILTSFMSTLLPMLRIQRSSNGQVVFTVSGQNG